MAVYLYEQFMTADTEAEAAALATRLGLPGDRLRLAGTPRWHWLLTPADYAWALTEGAREVGVDVFRRLVLQRRVDEAVAAAAAGGPLPAGVIACGPPPRRVARWNPTLRRHRWVRDREHVRHCGWCGLVTENRPVPKSGAWYRVWRWPGSAAPPGEWDGSTRDPDAGGKVPACPGPRENGAQTQTGP